MINSIMTKNPCYTSGRKITVKGLMLHSVGVPQPSAKVFINQWNKTSYNRACVHAFIDANTGDVYQTLPWNHRGWHGGGSCNDTHIGVEMCEPASIKYTGGATFVCTDQASAKAAVKRTYEAAVELFAFLCEEYHLNPLGKGVIVSHKEGHAMGIASNHGDPEHLWKQLGLEYTMKGFRNDVSARMGNSSSTVTKPVTQAQNGLYRVQVGAFENKANATKLQTKLKGKGFDTYLVLVGKHWKVQVGAFTKKESAEALLKKITDAGFEAFISGVAGTASDQMKVGSEVYLKKGAKTYDGRTLASFVYNRPHRVTEIKGDKVVIAYQNTVVAAVKKSDLQLN